MSMSSKPGASGAGARQTLPDKKPDRSGGEPPSPDSPLRSAGPLTRKRAASLRTDGPRIEDLSLNTPTTAERSSPPPQPPQQPQLPESGRDLICLCTPAPKVPRPRNGMSSFLRFCFLSLLAVCSVQFPLLLFLLQTHAWRALACCTGIWCPEGSLCLVSHSRDFPPSCHNKNEESKTINRERCSPAGWQPT